MGSERLHPDPSRMAAQNARIAEGMEFERELADLVPASRLNTTEKNAVWREIKANRPEQVAFFANPDVKRLIAAGAVPCFPSDLIAAALPSRNERGTKP